jgi:hypothetical protein
MPPMAANWFGLVSPRKLNSICALARLKVALLSMISSSIS